MRSVVRTQKVHRVVSLPAHIHASTGGLKGVVDRAMGCPVGAVPQNHDRPAALTVNATSVPGSRCNVSRMRLDTVTCPLLVKGPRVRPTPSSPIRKYGTATDHTPVRHVGIPSKAHNAVCLGSLQRCGRVGDLHQYVHTLVDQRGGGFGFFLGVKPGAGCNWPRLYLPRMTVRMVDAITHWPRTHRDDRRVPSRLLPSCRLGHPIAVRHPGPAPDPLPPPARPTPTKKPGFSPRGNCLSRYSARNASPLLA